ncbi:MAG: site-specific DNA-methyltransferase, partial [candidate division KSB1 bacterium]|nr:site-specific DNA-methyltransferase [candidate division KSB1 bacterium]
MAQAKLFEREESAIIPAIKPPALRFKRRRDARWDFRGTPASTGVYGIHPYPAMFHFRVIRQLIQTFSAAGDWIFDPFMGSGVVAVECLVKQRNFVGYDINPLAVLIAKARATPLSPKRLLDTVNLIDEKYRKHEPEPVEFHNIRFWFDNEVINDLSRLRQAIDSIDDEKVKNFFTVAFSEVVRRASKTEYSEFKLLRKKKREHPLDLIKTFKAICFKNIGLLADFYKALANSKTKIVLENRNILEPSPLKPESFDLVVTSPPYGDSRTTVAYGQFSRLSLRWLGLEETVDRTSLGGQAKTIVAGLPSAILYESIERIGHKDEKRAKEVFSFYHDLLESIRAISPTVKRNGHV